MWSIDAVVFIHIDYHLLLERRFECKESITSVCFSELATFSKVSQSINQIFISGDRSIDNTCAFHALTYLLCLLTSESA